MIVVWRVTETCNLSCGFCAYDRRLVRPRRTVDLARARTFGASLARWSSVVGERILVSWIGGEPLLWTPLEELTKTFHREYGLALSVTTNGTPLASPQTRAHLLEHYQELTVSVDAIGDEHDRLRGSRGLFARVKASVVQLAQDKRAVGAPLKLRANVVLMRNTIGRFPELCLELANWGVEEITFNTLGGRDRPEFFPENRLLPEQALALEEIVYELRSELRSRGVVLLGGSDYLRRIASTACGVRLPITDCKPGERFLFVDELGRVSPCSFTSAEYGVPLEELTPETAPADLVRRFSAQRESVRAPACEDCMSTHVFTKFENDYGS